MWQGTGAQTVFHAVAFDPGRHNTLFGANESHAYFAEAHADMRTAQFHQWPCVQAEGLRKSHSLFERHKFAQTGQVGHMSADNISTAVDHLQRLLR